MEKTDTDLHPKSSPEETPKEISYKYRFRFKNGLEKQFDILLDRKTLDVIPREGAGKYPDWVKLRNFRCSICSLDAGKHEFCPIAVNLIEIIDFFREYFSYERVDVSVKTFEREYSCSTSVQKAVSSLMGIYMVASGCPVMRKIEPMVRFHLPFSTLEETSYRTVSMYLLSQYFRQEQGKAPDWALEKLNKIYDDIRVVNQNICDKLTVLSSKDGIVNAVIQLDCFACTISLSLYKKLLKKFEKTFEPFE